MLFRSRTRRYISCRISLFSPYLLHSSLPPTPLPPVFIPFKIAALVAITRTTSSLTAAFAFAHLLALATPVPATIMLATNALAEATQIMMKLSSVPSATPDPLVVWHFKNASCALPVFTKRFQARPPARSVFRDMTGMAPMISPTIS